MTIHCKAVEQYLTAFQFYPVCNFGEFIKFGLSTVRNERIKLRLTLFVKTDMIKIISVLTNK